MSEVSGRILNLSCELPHHLSASQVGIALVELDLAVTGMRQPPVAKVESPFGAGNSAETMEDELDDYRRFWVEFEPAATQDDIIAVTEVVFAAFRRLNPEV